jgi:hypothetical protein
VSCFGEWSAVSAPEDPHAETSGAVYIFRRQNYDIIWSFSQLVRPEQAENLFGYTLAMGDQILAVSSKGYDHISAASVLIFRCKNSAWLQEARLLPSTNVRLFGHEVAFRERALLVAAFSESGWSPLLHIFVESPHGWALTNVLAYALSSVDFLSSKNSVANQLQISAYSREIGAFHRVKNKLTSQTCMQVLTAASSGSTVGNDETYIRLNGRELLPAYGRGMNVAQLDFSNLQQGALRTGVYDLFENSSAATGLVLFIESAPDGSVFAFAAQDDATNTATSQLRSILSSDFGATLFSSLQYQNSYVLLGVKGASSPGAEASSPSTVVTKSVCLDNGVVNSSVGTSYPASTPTIAPSTGKPKCRKHQFADIRCFLRRIKLQQSSYRVVIWICGRYWLLVHKTERRRFACTIFSGP